MKKISFFIFILSICGMAALYSGNAKATGGWYACFYDGSGCAQVPDQYGPIYAPAQTSMAACEALCPF
jgi:hypothetical protein